MKVIAIQGSPRRTGNTQIVLDAVLHGLKEKQPDAKITLMRAASMKILGCMEDFTCQTVQDSPGCPIEDDMNEIYMALLRADLIILASPVFCWGVTAQLKAVLDRLYAMFKFSEAPPRCLIGGKQMAFVVTAGGTATDGANLAESMYEQLVAYSNSVDKGRLVCPLMKEPADTAKNQKLLERARQFGASLA